MSLWKLGETPSEDPGSDLRQEIESLVSKIQEIREELPLPDDPKASNRAFRNYANYFSKIEKQLIGYTYAKRNPYYSYLQRSQGRIEHAKGAIDLAKKTAKLFERYSRKPHTYSQVDSDSQIVYLLAELDNLHFYCT